MVKCCEVDEKRNRVAGTEFVIKGPIWFLSLSAFAARMETGLISELGEQLSLIVDRRGSTNIAANEGDYRTSVATLGGGLMWRRGQSLVVWAIRGGPPGCTRHRILSLMGVHRTFPR